MFDFAFSLTGMNHAKDLTGCSVELPMVTNCHKDFVKHHALESGPCHALPASFAITSIRGSPDEKTREPDLYNSG